MENLPQIFFAVLPFSYEVDNKNENNYDYDLSNITIYKTDDNSNSNVGLVFYFSIDIKGYLELFLALKSGILIRLCGK